MTERNGLRSRRRRIVFIVGNPRSGTKLLRRLMTNHPSVFITSELMFVPYMLENWESYGDLSNIDNFRSMHRDIMKTYYFEARASKGVDLPGAEEWYADCESFDPTGVLLPLIRHETEAPDGGALWLGDKSPNYTTHVGDIRRGIPEAKIIHIVRDVRDAALSARKIWGKNMYRYAQRWADGLRLLRKDVESMAPGDYLEIRYEDLLSNPRAELLRVTDFLELEFHESMVRLERPAEGYGDARTISGILSDNTQKYKTQLTIRQQKKIEEICSEVLRRHGYDVVSSAPDRRLSRVRLTWYMLADIFNRALFDLRIGTSVGFVARSMVSKTRTRM